MLPAGVAIFTFISICLATAEVPIIELTPLCPTRISGIPSLLLTADVPAYGIARCKNGNKPFDPQNSVKHSLVGTFDQAYTGDDCGFHKKNGGNTFVVDVEVGWGEKNREVISHMEILTVSCAYDEHGKALTATETVYDGFLPPQEQLRMRNRQNTTSFVVVDVIGREVDWFAIQIGGKIKLKVLDTSETVQGFMARSCIVSNGFNSYAILRDGCGDGLVFDKTAGFYTQGSEVNSPFFDAFKMRGSDTVQFQCNFTVCSSTCDGDSCLVETRRRRIMAEAGSGGDNLVRAADSDLPVLSLISKHIRTKVVMEGDLESPMKSPEVGAAPPSETDYLMHLGTLLRDYPPHPKSMARTTGSEMVGFQLIAFVITLAGFVFVFFLLSVYMCVKYHAASSRSTQNKISC